ncbi:hypothetical protein Tco_0165886, partial [Tanacetum coccineum]
IIMVNVFPPDHVDDLPEVEPNQLNPALAIPELAVRTRNRKKKKSSKKKKSLRRNNFKKRKKT